MQTPFDEWLRSLRGDGKLAENIPAATRGLAWSEPVVIEGDWSTAALEGTLRLMPGDATAQATLTVGSGTYDAGADETTFVASLAGATTGGLPADDDFDGLSVFAMSLRLTPSGENKITLFGGAFILREIA